MADDPNPDPETPESSDTPSSGPDAGAADAQTETAAAGMSAEHEHAVPTEDAREIAGSAEDAALEAVQEAGEHPDRETVAETEQFAPIAGNAVPSDDAAEIAGSAEDAPLEAAQEQRERVEAEEMVEAYEDDVAHEIAEKIAPEIVQEAIVEEAVIEELAEEIVAEEVAEEIVAEAVAEEVEAEIEIETVAETLAEKAVAETVEAELSSEVDAELEAEAALEADEDDEEESESAPREKPAVPGAHLEVDIVPEGVDPLGRDIDSELVDPYAIVAEAYETEEAEEPEIDRAAAELQEEPEILSQPISSAAIDLASGARYRATGKRKTAIARVTLRPGTGTYLVNGRVLEEHFPRATLQRNIRQPLETVGYQDRMDVIARLHGGGISAQAGALRHGVSRALLEADPNLRGELKRRGFLTRDSRAKERKKAGLKKARKRPQFSKR
jgi:small subunit ribosomal protein S9